MPTPKSIQVESNNKPQGKGLILQLQNYAHQELGYQRIPPYQGEFAAVRYDDHQCTKDMGHSKTERNLLPQGQCYDKRTVKPSSQTVAIVGENTTHPTGCQKMFDCHQPKEYDHKQSCHQEHFGTNPVKHNVAGHLHDPT